MNPDLKCLHTQEKGCVENMDNFDLFNLDIGNEELVFEEDCIAIDELVDFVRPFNIFEEAVQDTEYNIKRKAKDTVRNTVDTTASVVKAYDKVTDAKAKSYKSLWDIAVKSMNLVTKVITFVCNRVSGITNGVLKVSSNIMDIPDNVRNKIKGNIKLFITVNDFEMLYRYSVMAKIGSYILQLQSLSKGDTWTTFFKGRGILGTAKAALTGQFSKTDKQKINEMNKIYSGLQNIKFEETTVDMSDKGSIKAYFSNEKIISFTDNKGAQHNYSYFDGLKVLLDDVSKYKETLTQLNEMFSDKLKDSQGAQKFAELSNGFQKDIINALHSISGIISFLGNMTRCIQKDCATINENTKIARKKVDKINAKDVKKK